MYEVTPILSTPATGYMPAVSNVSSATINTDNTSDPTAASTVDPRRYTQFDRTATEAGTATMSFDDFVDMVNPLQHIPLISSAYRAITGETINPVSRVVGDILYSGPMGVASAAVSGIGAIANSVLESQTGSDGATTVMAALFGTDDKASVQTADNTTTSPAVTAQQMPLSLVAAAVSASPAKTPVLPNTQKLTDAEALAETEEEVNSESDPSSLPTKSIAVANAVAKSQAVSQAAPQATPQLAKPQPVAEDSDTPAETSSGNGLVASLGPKLLPLDRSRINNISAMASNIESQNRIIALSEGSHEMRLGHMIYTNPLMNGTKPMPNHTNPSTNPITSNAATPSVAPTAAPAAMPTSAAITAPAASASTTTLPPSSDAEASSTETSIPAYAQGTQGTQPSILSTQAQTSAMPPALFDDVMILKRINQYKSFAKAPVTNGATLDITN